MNKGACKMKNAYSLPCNIAQTLNLIGDRWTLLILYQLMQGHDTFKELQESLTGIPTNLLSDRLKSLEADQLITPKLYQSHPPRYRYELTGGGSDLGDIFNSLMLWGERNLDKCHKHLTHIECGHSIELQYYCSKCKRPVSKEELQVIEEE
jgi:DNA-binding HxlR family transcriptional regulator